MLVPGEAPVEHRGAGEASTPAVGVAKVAPGVETQPLLHGAAFIRYRGPRAQVVLEDVVGLVDSVAALDHGEDVQRAAFLDDAREAVEPVVCEAFLHVGPVVLSGGLDIKTVQ